MAKIDIAGAKPMISISLWISPKNRNSGIGSLEHLILKANCNETKIRVGLSDKKTNKIFCKMKSIMSLEKLIFSNLI